jgi:pilus assembly protein CpaB
MNRRRFLVIGVVALTFGALASLRVYNQLRAMIPAGSTGVDVVVAAKDIQVGAKLRDDDLNVLRYPPGNLPPHVFHTKASALVHGVVLLPIGKGEFVVSEKLAGEEAGAGLSGLIARGMRAVAVRVNEVSNVAGFVAPRARVDVVVTGHSPGSSELQTITVLQDIAVLATGQNTDSSVTGAQNATVVTLEASPEDAEKLALASQEGHIQLVLRNPVDTDQEKRAPIRNTTLFGGTVSRPTVELKRVKHSPVQAPEPTTEIDILRGGREREIFKLKQ